MQNKSNHQISSFKEQPKFRCREVATNYIQIQIVKTDVKEMCSGSLRIKFSVELFVHFTRNAVEV